MSTMQQIIDYWFAGDEAERKQRWWQKSEAVDDEIRERFEADWQAIVDGGRQDWLETAEGTLAYVLVLDQLGRNMHRGKAKMYAGDDKARAAVLAALERGDDRALDAMQRAFLYMPLMHSEELPHLDRCVSLFEAMKDAGDGDWVDYAEQHRAIVARFGRYPHRNEILGREHTDEEEAFLEEPGSSF